MSRTVAQIRKRRLQMLARRMKFLEERIDDCEITGTSYDKAELAALRWAVTVIERAIATGLISDLEV